VTLKGKGTAGIAIAVSTNRANSRSAIYQVKTDQEGHYRISNVLAGSYEVSPNAPGFVVSMRSGSAAIIVGEGETIEDVNFSLTKGAVITGRVTNSDGQPLVEQGITLQPVENNSQIFGNRYIGFGQPNMTDDRGIYRIFGLPQGKYKVSVGQNEDSLFTGSSRRRSIRQTFYPGVSDFAKAAIVEVSEGGEAKNIDITVDTNDNSQRFAVTGRIVDGVSGEPVSNLNLGLQHTAVDRTESMIGGFLASDNRGQFKIEGLSPGKYGIFIEGGPNSDLRADPVAFEIIDADVDGIVIKTVRGASVSGQIFLESDDKSIRSKLNQLTLSANVNVNSQSSFHNYGKSVRIKPDLSFQIGGLQEGLVNFSVYSLDGSLRGVGISRIERDGLVQSSGVEVKDGEQVTGLKILLNVNTGTIRGVVKTEHGELPPTARISLWLSISGVEGGRMQPQSMPGPIVDSRGHFVVEGVAAGTYEVNANVFIPDARRSFSAKQQVNVSDGVVSEVTLNIDLSPQPF
jgi:protocatechuate 3,4-dioxygenase beta subunit